MKWKWILKVAIALLLLSLEVISLYLAGIAIHEAFVEASLINILRAAYYWFCAFSAMRIFADSANL